MTTIGRPTARRALLPALLLVGLVALLAAASGWRKGPGVVILVRHAEKAAVEGSDPPLSAEGRVRAEALRDALASAGVQAIVTTQLQRTQQTAQPLAARLGLTPGVVSTVGGAERHVQATVEAVRALPAGSTALVVGHSNTVPALVRALGGEAAGNIPDPVYDQVWVLRLDGGAVRTLRLRYGAPTPEAP